MKVVVKVKAEPKICILVPCLGYGGAEKQITLISPYLKSKGYNVAVVSMIPALAYQDLMGQYGIKLFEGSFSLGKFSFRSFSEIRSYIKTEDFDVIITFNYPANILGRILKLSSRKLKVISSFRSVTFGNSTREKLIRITSFLDSLTIPNSNFAAQSFITRGVIKEDKCLVIPNALDINSLESSVNLSANVYKDVDRPEKEFRWIIVGRFERAKDYPNLIKSVEILKNYYKVGNFKLSIIGDGSLLEEVKQNIRDLGLEGIVKLLGNKRAVAPYLVQADAFVLSSAWEGMPNAVMEAMLCKLPVVSTLAGGVVDLITEKENGFLVPTKNADALAKAMYNMMNLNEEERLQIGRSNRDKMLLKHNLNTVGNQWEDAIRLIL
jgi:glycosyltransferase involved in cell wall biosynthesis